MKLVTRMSESRVAELLWPELCFVPPFALHDPICLQADQTCEQTHDSRPPATRIPRVSCAKFQRAWASTFLR